ncbi:hypothetical protein KBP30_40930 [Streptomyces sp. Go40/10]|uniref:hypothetical protein n=1 Tax=Streptomyces sp. Go40/10 TaxID=2825844 RepID=UPI001E36D9C6|nr:hypothetical protein [Streptomyces sp. Go40/10]UFR07114.1 hypothetical protein KBP30_40930 [Streptomyces sp. Go40/10]
MAELLSKQARATAAAPVLPAAAQAPPMPVYKKKDMIRAEVDRHVERLARMQSRRAGNDSPQHRGKRQTSINTDLMRRFGARSDCTASTLKRILDHLATEIKKQLVTPHDADPPWQVSSENADSSLLPRLLTPFRRHLPRHRLEAAGATAPHRRLDGLRHPPG